MAPRKSTFLRSPRIALPAALALALVMAAPARATMIAIYLPPGKALEVETLKALALEVKNNPEAARNAEFSCKTSAKSVLTAEFSVPPGASAYFWSDETFSRDGYVMGGEAAHYEVEVASEEALAKPGLDVEATPEKVFSTELRSAVLSARTLNLAYSVTKPGMVKIDVFGANGQRAAGWRLEEGAGEHVRSFAMRATAKGPLYVRWTAGNTQAVRKINPASAGPMK